jgi:hypothetical protein
MSVKVTGMVWDLVLESGEKLVLLAYADHAAHDGTRIWPSMATIARMTGYSERQVQRITHSLESKGVLMANGRGPKGTKKWNIPIVGGDIVSPCQDVRGDIHDIKGVTFRPKRGDIAMSPEPSLTVIKPSLTISSTENTISQANQKVDAILEQSRQSKHHWPGREKFTPIIRDLMDAFVDCTGIKPINGQVNDWLSTGSDWQQIGAHPADIREAFKRTRPDHNGKGGFTILRPGSLTGMIQAVVGEKSGTNGKQSHLEIIQEAMRKHQQEQEDGF